MTTEESSPLSPQQREGLAHIFDVVVPGTDVSPSGRSVAAHEDLMDLVLSADPTLAGIVSTTAEHAATQGGCTLGDLKAWAGEDAERLLFAVHAAYYMSSTVRAALHYPGQKQVPISLATPDQLCSDELVAPVVERGPVYVDPSQP